MAQAGSVEASPPCSECGPDSLALAVFTDMLLADPAHGNVPTCAIGQGQAEDTFGLKQALGMVAHGSVREEGEVLFRGIEPVMYGLIVGRHPAEFELSA